jgi:hypothetical protein
MKMKLVLKNHLMGKIEQSQIDQTRNAFTLILTLSERSQISYLNISNMACSFRVFVKTQSLVLMLKSGFLNVNKTACFKLFKQDVLLKTRKNHFIPQSLVSFSIRPPKFQYLQYTTKLSNFCNLTILTSFFFPQNAHIPSFFFKKIK